MEQLGEDSPPGGNSASTARRAYGVLPKVAVHTSGWFLGTVVAFFTFFCALLALKMDDLPIGNCGGHSACDLHTEKQPKELIFVL